MGTLTLTAAPEARPVGRDDQARLIEALRIGNPQLVAEVTGVVRTLVAEEVTRQARLDAKATSLLTSIGLSVSVVAVLIPRAQHYLTQAFLVGFAVLALTAGALALWALRVATYERMSAAGIFDASVLSRADDKEGGAAVALYQRHLVPNMWKAYALSLGVNDRRATAISVGQAVFGVALVAVSVGATLLVVRP